MSYSLQIQHEAVVEAHKIFEWYESKQQGLGFEFVESLERAYYDISGGANYSFAITKLVFIFKK